MTGPVGDGAAGLDWQVVVEAWARCAHTRMGEAEVRALAPLPSAPAIRAAHDAVDEWRGLHDRGVDTGLGGVGDARKAAERGARGEVLDDAELRDAGSTLRFLRQLGATLEREQDDAPTLHGIAGAIDLDDEVVDLLEVAWDATGQLSAKRWPRLGELRAELAALHERVRRTLDHLVAGDALADTLQDRFWTTRDNRYVLPMKHHAKGYDLGIVHDTSRTGQTVFVEPHQVIALNNQIRVTEGELQAEEHRVRALLSRSLGTQRDAVAVGTEAAIAIDLAASRAGLARALGAVRPAVGDGGVVALIAARHPVLVLRGVAVVANDLALRADAPGLVISGPNAGGKTVALKTVGLCALLVQHGCFVPAAEGSRVDRFERVFAAIGDQQTVEGDLSSFSGHLVALRRILDESGPGTLCLLDEIASGTDPAQGAALAQAVLEALLDRGARIVVTTHFARLKGLAASDPRFGMAATQYVEGRPTYRLVTGATGESRALELARRVGLPDALLDRADALIDRGDAALAQSLEALETQRGAVVEAEARLARERTELQAREAAIAQKEARIAERSRALEADGAAAYLQRLRHADQAIGQVVAELQRDPSHAGVKAARAAIDALRTLAPVHEPADDAPTDGDLAPGDRVRLVKLGQAAEVIEVGPKAVKVRAGGLLLTVKPSEVARLDGDPPPATRAPARTSRASDGDLDGAVRLGNNTLDLRGKRVDESQEAAEKFFDQALLAGQDAVFLLHGHGTGALKSALRRWLGGCRYVRDWAPASEEQGGDAFTVVRLG